MNAVTKEEKQWTLVKAALSLPRPLGTVCAVFALIAFTGYLGSIEPLYRPIGVGPATHPLTALSILLLGLGLRANSQTRLDVWGRRVFAILAIVITVFRLGESLIGTDLTSWVTPFHSKVLIEVQLGKHNSMGVNTAGMLLSIAFAMGLYSLNFPKWSQIVASIAVAIPTISFTGYAYGLEKFYGQMSMLTATAGFCLAGATLALTSDHGGLRAILSPYIGGRIARIQVVAGYLIPTVFGYVLIKSMVSGSTQNYSMFGIFVVAICWFIILMVGISAILQEKADFARRQSEAILATAALTDSLTGVPNRRMFIESGQHELERIKRTGSELWLMMIDIDHFKKINDTAGHAIGDRVLVAVAQLLSQSIRKVDRLGRLGGEEFAVLIADTNLEGCKHVAENIRQNVESLQVPDWTVVHGPVTASIGCAKLTGTNSLEEALNAADEALYQAKRGGRNQVTIHDGITEHVAIPTV